MTGARPPARPPGRAAGARAARTEPGNVRPRPAEGADPGHYLDMPVRQFVDALAAPGPEPGGGAAAALTLTLAASLCEMSAHLSQRHLPEAPRLARDAARLRALAAPLAQADAEGYQAVLAAMRRQATARAEPVPAAEAGAPVPAGVAAALSGASAAPMRVAEIAADVAALASVLATGGNPSVRGDAITAAALAAAAAHAAAALVHLNLAGTSDGRPARARRHAAQAARDALAARRAAEGAGQRAP